MYTRNYQMQRDTRSASQACRPSCDEKDEARNESCLPPIDERCEENNCDADGSCRETNAPVTDETCENVRKRRYRAVRVPRLKEPETPRTDEFRYSETENCGCVREGCEPSRCDEPCEQEKCRDGKSEHCTESCERSDERPCRAHERGGLGGFFKNFTSDEMLIVALVILLMCQGGDDILILALCFILA